jgi:hypothetical protein
MRRQYAPPAQHIDEMEYGIDPAIAPQDDEDAVEVTPLRCPFDEEFLQIFRDEVNPLTLETNDTADLQNAYFDALHFARDLYQQQMQGV